MKWIKTVFRSLMMISILVVAVGIYARYIEPTLLKATTYEVEVPSDVASSRIVFFSDTHIGSMYPQEELEKIINKINKQQPDVVIFGGDFFDNYARDREHIDTQAISMQLQNIQATYGKYAVFGNHDYGGGAARIYEKMMTDGGFKVLINESVLLKELNIRMVGFDDYLLGRTSKELYRLKSNTYNIIISHEPDVADLISTPKEGMVLAGHSHGGQVNIPFLTDKVLPVGARKYVKGYYPYTGTQGDLPLYVSTGIGTTVYPIRFLNIPEIMVMELKN